jgi:subfamily B ATP-binding cassette protein MsbA
MNTFKGLWHIVRPYKKTLFLVIVITGIITGINLCFPLVIRAIIDKVITKKQWSSLFIFISFLILIRIFSSILLIFNSYILSKTSQKILFKGRLSVYSHVIKHLSHDTFRKLPAGAMANRIMGDMAVLSVLLAVIRQLIISLILFIFSLFIMIYLNWSLTLIVIVISILYFLNYKFFAKRIKANFRSLREVMDKIADTIQERIGGIQKVKIFNKEQHEIQEFTAGNRKQLNFSMKGIIFQSFFSSIAQVITGLGNAVIFFLGCYLVLKSKMTYGDVTAFCAYAQIMLNPALQITYALTFLQRAYISSERLQELLDIPPQVKENPNAKIVQFKKGDIEFKDVYFQYEKDVEVLKKINLYIPHNKITALVGHTGCGKTTLVNLILRHYDVNRGQILIDRTDIRDIKLNTLRRQIALVLQDTILLPGTILENITYGVSNVSREEIENAAKAAEIHNIISSLPQGYKTIIGPEGLKLSEGQNQRLAIARALMINPKILILDEATSFQDSESEHLIQKAIKQLVKNITCIVIAHRLTTVEKADNIVVIDRGEIKEQGSHQELIDKNGFYNKLHSLRFFKNE